MVNSICKSLCSAISFARSFAWSDATHPEKKKPPLHNTYYKIDMFVYITDTYRALCTRFHF